MLHLESMSADAHIDYVIGIVNAVETELLPIGYLNWLGQGQGSPAIAPLHDQVQVIGGIVEHYFPNLVIIPIRCRSPSNTKTDIGDIERLPCSPGESDVVTTANGDIK
jgi:hypothetical protein